MKDARESIAARALELFNEKGIEYVGMREIAGTLDTRIGNITYYFPTKDDLVFHLGSAYQQLNTETRAAHTGAGLYGMLQLFSQLFRNQVRYRCLLLSFVHLMEHNPLMADTYKSIRTSRTAANEAMLRAAAEAGDLKADEEQLMTLARSFNLIARFWLSEAILSGYKRSSLDRQIPVYLNLIGGLLQPYATAKGKRELARFLQEEG